MIKKTVISPKNKVNKKVPPISFIFSILNHTNQYNALFKCKVWNDKGKVQKVLDLKNVDGLLNSLNYAGERQCEEKYGGKATKSY